MRDGIVTKRTFITDWYMAHPPGRAQLIVFAKKYMQYSVSVANAVGTCSDLISVNESKALDILCTITKSAEPMLDLILSNVVGPFFDNQKKRSHANSESKETKRKKRKDRDNNTYDQGDESQDIDEYLGRYPTDDDIDDDDASDDDGDPALPIQVTKIAKPVKTATTDKEWRYHGKLTERDHPTEKGPLSRSLFSYSRSLFLSLSVSLFIFFLVFVRPFSFSFSLRIYRPRSRPLALLSFSCSLSLLISSSFPFSFSFTVSPPSFSLSFSFSSPFSFSFAYIYILCV
jgi:hypothetical protein